MPPAELKATRTWEEDPDGKKGATEGPMAASLSLGAESLSPLGPRPWFSRSYWFHGHHRDHKCSWHLCRWGEEGLNQSV